MTTLTSLQSALGIRPNEHRLVWFAFAVFFLGGTGRALGVSAAYSAFLSQFGGDFVPYIYILTGVIMVALMSLYVRLSARISLRRTLGIILGFSTAMFMLLAVWLALSPSPVVIFAAPVWFEGFCVLLPLALWSLAGRLFTVRQGKRLFGIVASGIPLGFILGGFLTNPIAVRFGAAGLLAAAAISLLFTLIMALAANSIFPDRFVGDDGSAIQRSPQIQTAGSLWGSRYVLLIFGILGSWTMAFFFVDNIFLERISAQFATEAEVAAIMGIYSMARGVFMLLSGMFVAGPILNRFGVRIGLLVLPLGLAVGSLTLIVPGMIWGVIPFLFWPAFVTKLLNYALDTVDRSSLSILYQPLPINVRLRVQTVTEGILRPAMMAVTGALLLVLTNALGFSVVQLAVGLMVVLAVWLIIAVLTGREYPKMLMTALMRRRLGDGEMTLDDDSCRLVLQQAMRSERADVVLYALNRLEDSLDATMTPILLSLLDHPLPAVRQEVLARLERSGNVEIFPALERRLAVESAAEVRGALLRTAVAVDPDHMFDNAVAALGDETPVVRQGAAAGLLLHGGIGGVLAAGPQVLKWIESSAAADRITGARTLGDVGVGVYYQPLIPLFSDDDPSVRRAAVIAAGAMCNARLWPFVVAALALPETAQPALSALTGGGDNALPAIAAAWQDRPPKWLSLRLAQVCGRIRTPAVTTVLLERIGCDDSEVRGAVLQALQRCGYKAGVADAASIYALVKRDGSETAWVTAARVDLGDDDALALLCAALDIELTGQRARVLHLLSFVSDAHAVRRAQDILNAPLATSDQRAYAQEILDLVTPQELKAVVLALVDDLPPHTRLRRLQSYAPQNRASAAARLRQLVVSPDGRFNGWTVACALAAMQRSDADHRAAITVAATSSDPLVRETATWVLGRIDGQSPPLSPTTNHLSQEKTMLSTLERVIILKSAAIFGAVPDNLLAAVAATAEEVVLDVSEQLFAKGDLGKEMYVIVTGSVRIHDGVQTLNQLGAYEVFGEMALLDAEPRSASVTASEETLLLRLRQEEFFDLLEDHGAIARGVIRVLSQRLRARSEELAQARSF